MANKKEQFFHHFIFLNTSSCHQPLLELEGAHWTPLKIHLILGQWVQRDVYHFPKFSLFHLSEQSLWHSLSYCFQTFKLHFTYMQPSITKYVIRLKMLTSCCSIKSTMCYCLCKSFKAILIMWHCESYIKILFLFQTCMKQASI